LPASLLGLTSQNIIWIDQNAQGYSWYTDVSPSSAAAFTQVASANEVQATVGSPAYGHVDLLTVVTHELGHVLGFASIDAGILDHDWMTATLATGVRRAPDTIGQAAPASPPLVSPLRADVPLDPLAGQPTNVPTAAASQVGIAGALAAEAWRLEGRGAMLDDYAGFGLTASSWTYEPEALGPPVPGQFWDSTAEVLALQLAKKDEPPPAAWRVASAGADVLVGGDGDDMLIGSAGQDILVGGMATTPLGQVAQFCQ
jgi:hypothetical protein